LFKVNILPIGKTDTKIFERLIPQLEERFFYEFTLLVMLSKCFYKMKKAAADA
jgi:hypothetical protein